MAYKVGYPVASQGLLTDVDTVQRNPLGQVAFDEAGAEYIYLQGIGSTVVGSVVTYGLTATNAHLTALSVTGARGPVAIAMAITVASNYGWYLRRGAGTAITTERLDRKSVV